MIMKSFSKNRFLTATILTISFMGASLLAPFTVQAEQTQGPMGGEFQQTNQKHDLIDIFSDEKMQADAAGIVVSCVLAAYLPDIIETIAGGATVVVESLRFTAEVTEKGTAAISPANMTIPGVNDYDAGIVGQKAAEVFIVAGDVAVAPSEVTPIRIANPAMEAFLASIANGVNGLHYTFRSANSSAIGSKKEQGAKDTITDCLVYGAGQLLLKQLTQNTVNWIKGGFHGSPSFAVNTHEVFLDLADMVAGDLAREIRGISMCKFSANFQNDLANNIELSAKHIYKFNGATKCPFPETINVNSSDFYRQANNFTWAGLEYAMQDAGNPFGVALLSGQELALRSSEKAEVRKQELSWSNGFTNMVDTDNCDYPEGYLIYEYETSDGKSETRGQYDRAYDSAVYGPTPEGAEGGEASIELNPKEVQNLQKTYCKTTTPGKLVGDQLTKATGIDMDRLGAVDSLNKIIGALIERLTQDATMGIFNTLSGQDAKVQQNYIVTQDKTAETMAMENYAIKSAKDALATAQKELADARAETPPQQDKIYALIQKVENAQKRVDAVTSADSAIARQNELNAAHAEVDNALSAERSAQARADVAQKAYYIALQGTLDGGTYIQPDPATLSNLKNQWDSANEELIKAQGVTANARQRLYDAQHP